MLSSVTASPDESAVHRPSQTSPKPTPRKPTPKSDLVLPVIITENKAKSVKKKKVALDPKELEILSRSFEVDKLGVSYNVVPACTLLLKRNMGLQDLPEGDEELKAVIRTATAAISNLLRSADRPKVPLVQQYFRRALAYEKLCRFDIAEEEYTNCIKTNNKCAEAYFNRAGVLRSKNSLPAAIR